MLLQLNFKIYSNALTIDGQGGDVMAQVSFRQLSNRSFRPCRPDAMYPL